MSIKVSWMEYDIYGNMYDKDKWFTTTEDADKWVTVLREHEKVNMVTEIIVENIPDN